MPAAQSVEAVPAAFTQFCAACAAVFTRPAPPLTLKVGVTRRHGMRVALAGLCLKGSGDFPPLKVESPRCDIGLETECRTNAESSARNADGTWTRLGLCHGRVCALNTRRNG